MKMAKDTLMNCVQGKLGDLSSVDAKELGEAIDMIKDLSEAIYYCTITKSMEGEEKENGTMYYTMPKYNPDYRYYDRGRDMDKPYGRMYYEDHYKEPYTGDRKIGYGSDGIGSYPIEIRDRREGRSPVVRKTYMERKMHGETKEAQMHELEKYLHELSNDITEMIEGASTEEKQMLKSKMTTLANKIV